MDQEKNWMLITYYCPTHGDSGLVKHSLKKVGVLKINFLN